MTYYDQMQDLLSSIGSGYVSSSAYDTAWIAQLGDLEPELSTRALDWLRTNQLPDGSWGTPEFEYHHDRFICTLASMIALTRCGSNGDHKRVEKAGLTLDRWIRGLRDDSAGDTIGFELLVPTLIDEGRALGLITDTGSDILYEMAAKRTLKLVNLPDKLINRYVTVAFSSEMVGLDAQILLDVERLQDKNGSLACSPSATAFYARYVCQGDPAALSYISRIVEDDGGAPNVGPIDIFEIAWILWDLLMVWPADEVARMAAPLIDRIEQAWQPGRGIGACSGAILVDSDDTAIVYEVLTRLGRRVELQVILEYETDTHFRCYPLEANPSLSANIHILQALRVAGMSADHPSVQKIVRFLKQTRLARSYWYDKWHVSPYYTTAHALIACAGFIEERFVAKAADWILYSQNENGSWGYYLPTAEETAYALQALISWRRQGGNIPLEPIQLAASWLTEHAAPPYPMLWIGKSLYCPEKVVQGAVLSALLMAEQELEGTEGII